jgi:hypothetical protein
MNAEMNQRREQIAQALTAGLVGLAQAMLAVSSLTHRAAIALEATAEKVEDMREHPPTGPTMPPGATGPVFYPRMDDVPEGPPSNP